MPPKPLLRTMLGKVLRRIRLEQGRTLEAVARAARISMPYLSEVERGRKEASSEVLAAVCDALHVDLREVLTEVGRGRPVEAGRDHTVVVMPDRTVTSIARPGSRRFGRGTDAVLLAA